MSKEAMKLALEALSPWAGEDANHTEQYAAYQALREALAEQPAQQEPVAWMQNTTAGLYVIDHCDEWHCIPLYTSPPAQRKPLTDEQYRHMLELFVVPPHHLEMVIRAIEAAHGIKEKNT